MVRSKPLRDLRSEIDPQGLGPRVTDWFDLYLRGQTQRVRGDDATSDHLYLLDGAVQDEKWAVGYIKNMLNDYIGYADDNAICKPP